MKPDTPPDRVEYVHVYPDGGEDSYAVEPRDVPTLRIEVHGDFEYTRTHDNTVPIGYPPARLAARPPGEDWEQFDPDASKDYSDWRRPVRKGAR